MLCPHRGGCEVGTGSTMAAMKAELRLLNMDLRGTDITTLLKKKKKNTQKGG